MELKVICNCGQKYKFDVDPVHGRMPFPINCPVCNADGTPIANGLLAQMPQPAFAPAPAPLAPAIAAPPVPAAAAPPPVPIAAMAATAPAPVSTAGAGLRINKAAAAPPIAPPIPAAAAAATRPTAVPKYMKANAATSYNNFALGILGALIGAGVAIGLMGAFIMFTGFRFPYLGTVEGALIGFGARLLYRGTSSTLGAMSALVAFLTIALTYLLFFNIIAVLLGGLISMAVGVMIAFKVAS